MNQVTLIGTLGKDPEMKGAVCKFSIATNDGTKDKPKTNWHNIAVFGAQADVAIKYLSKGKKVAITGRIDYNEHEGKVYTSILCNSLELLSPKDGNTTSDDRSEYSGKVPF